MDTELLPKKIKVLGKDIKVVIMDLDGLHGEFDIDKREIRIDRSLSNEAAADALRHEFFHAVLGIGGYAYELGKKKEEGIVRLLESGTEGFVFFK